MFNKYKKKCNDEFEIMEKFLPKFLWDKLILECQYNDMYIYQHIITGHHINVDSKGFFYIFHDDKYNLTKFEIALNHLYK